MNKQEYFNPLENLSIEEKRLIITDLLKSNPMERSLKIVTCDVKPYSSLFSNHVVDSINSVKCYKYNINSTIEVGYKIKERINLPLDYNQYK
jgi:hypothetical protein